MLGPLAWEGEGFAEVRRRNGEVSRWLMASVLLQWSSNNLFVVSAGLLLGASAVGALKAAQGLLGLLHVLFQTVENTLVVRASKRFQQGGVPAVAALLRQVALGYGWVPAVVAFIFAATPEFWLTLVFGDSYAGYGHLVRWFAAIYLVIFAGAILRSGLRAIEHTRPIFLALLGTTVFTLLAAYPLVRWLGLTGVMGGMLTVHLIRQFTFWRAFQLRVANSPSRGAPAAMRQI